MSPRPQNTLWAVYPDGTEAAAFAELRWRGAEIVAHHPALCAMEVVLPAGSFERPLGCFNVVMEMLAFRRLEAQALPELTAEQAEVDLKHAILCALDKPRNGLELGNRLAFVVPRAWELVRKRRTLEEFISSSCNAEIEVDREGDRRDLPIYSRRSGIEPPKPRPVAADTEDVLKVFEECVGLDWDLSRLRWRATCIRLGSHPFKAPHVARELGHALINAFPDSTVDMVNFDKEAVCWLRDEWMVLGLRRPNSNLQLVEDKSDVNSRAFDQTACIVANWVHPLLPDGASKILDPMCGVGTYLAAHAWRAGPEPGAKAPVLYGCDVEAESVAAAAHNVAAAVKRFGGAASSGQFTAGSTERLPFDAAVFDAVVVDPPWGHRHGRHWMVQRGMAKWAAEWMRVLKAGGWLVVVTIRTKQFETETVPYIRRFYDFDVESIQFDNGGHKQCRCYLLQKKAAPNADVLKAPFPPGKDGDGENLKHPV